MSSAKSRNPHTGVTFFSVSGPIPFTFIYLEVVIVCETREYKFRFDQKYFIKIIYACQIPKTRFKRFLWLNYKKIAITKIFSKTYEPALTP